jgi:aarF domain-containing kinase
VNEPGRCFPLNCITGQAIGANAALLPRAFQSRFAKLFDDAPQVPYETVLKVFKQEFNRPPDGPDGVFAIFEHEAAASASVAQVHRAKTHDGEWVAVKIQKPAVGKQVSWDLASFKMVMWMYEHWVFNLPVYFVAGMISFFDVQIVPCSSLLKTSSRRTCDASLTLFWKPRTHKRPWHTSRVSRDYGTVSMYPRSDHPMVIRHESRSRHDYLQVYSEYSTTRVMTAEWIDGVRLSDKAGVRRLMGEDGRLKTELKTPEGLKDVGPLKGGLKVVGQTMVLSVLQGSDCILTPLGRSVLRPDLRLGLGSLRPASW